MKSYIKYYRTSGAERYEGVIIDYGDEDSGGATTCVSVLFLSDHSMYDIETRVAFSSAYDINGYPRIPLSRKEAFDILIEMIKYNECRHVIK